MLSRVSQRKTFSHSSVLSRAAGSRVSGPQVVPFKLADVGEGIAEVRLTRSRYVKPGDTIKQFDKVCEVQSDKATVEISSRFDGVVQELNHEVGDMAQVGAPLMLIDTQTDEAGAPPNAAPASGRAAPSATPEPPAATQAEPSRPSGGKVLATPAVRNLAKQHNIDLSQVVGTGREGRVMKADIQAFVGGGSAAAPTPSPPTSTPASSFVPSTPAPSAAPPVFTPPPAPLYQPVAEDVEVPLRGYSRAMAKTMGAAASVPAFGYMDEITMDPLIEIRKQLKPVAEGRGVRLTLMPFLLKATSMALTRHPRLNSSVNSDVSGIIQKASHNLGFAMDTPEGLVVPNVKNVQHLSVFQIAAEMGRIQQLAAERKLSADELTGGTFTLSNVGNIGGTYTSPIALLPEVAIGAIGATKRCGLAAEGHIPNVTAFRASTKMITLCQPV